MTKNVNIAIDEIESKIKGFRRFIDLAERQNEAYCQTDIHKFIYEKIVGFTYIEIINIKLDNHISLGRKEIPLVDYILELHNYLITKGHYKFLL